MSAVSSSLANVVGLSAKTPTVANVSLTLADTEYSYNVPNGTKYLGIQNRLEGLVKLSYVLGDSGTNYVTIFPGETKGLYNLATSGLTLYFQSPKASQLLEIESWV